MSTITNDVSSRAQGQGDSKFIGAATVGIGNSIILRGNEVELGRMSFTRYGSVGRRPVRFFIPTLHKYYLQFSLTASLLGPITMLQS